MKLIKFYATWCGPCKLMAPIVDKFVNKHHDKIEFVEIDVDNDEEAAKKYKVMGLPTIILEDESGTLLRLSGTMNESIFFEKFESAMAKDKVEEIDNGGCGLGD